MSTFQQLYIVMQSKDLDITAHILEYQLLIPLIHVRSLDFDIKAESGQSIWDTVSIYELCWVSSEMMCRGSILPILFHSTLPHCLVSVHLDRKKTDTNYSRACPVIIGKGN